MTKDITELFHERIKELVKTANVMDLLTLANTYNALSRPSPEDNFNRVMQCYMDALKTGKENENVNIPEIS